MVEAYAIILLGISVIICAIGGFYNTRSLNLARERIERLEHKWSER